MLASVYRLKNPRDIARVFRRGRYTAAEEVSVKATPNHLQVSRLAIVVSKKVSKKAVLRNKIRRRLSGQIEQRWQTVATGYDIVVTVREDISSLGTPDISRRVDKCLSQLRLINSESE